MRQASLTLCVLIALIVTGCRPAATPGNTPGKRQGNMAGDGGQRDYRQVGGA